MNELKSLAIKAKSRLLNKGFREIYSITNTNKQNNFEYKTSSKLNIPQFIDEKERKRQILNLVKSKIV